MVLQALVLGEKKGGQKRRPAVQGSAERG